MMSFESTRSSIPAGVPDAGRACHPGDLLGEGLGEQLSDESYDATRSMGHLILNVMVMMRREVDLRMVAHGLTNAQWKPLWMIARGRAETANEMARVLDVDASAVTRLVDRLEAKGLIARVRSSTDRRVVKLVLTAAGEQTVKAIAPVLAAVNDDFLHGFSADQIQALQESLLRMAANGTTLLGRCTAGELDPADPAPTLEQAVQA